MVTKHSGLINDVGPGEERQESCASGNLHPPPPNSDYQMPLHAYKTMQKCELMLKIVIRNEEKINKTRNFNPTSLEHWLKIHMVTWLALYLHPVGDDLLSKFKFRF